MSGESVGEVLICHRDDGSPFNEVTLEGGMVWLSQHQITQLAQISRTNVVEQHRNIYDESEPQVEAACRKVRQTRIYGLRELDRRILALEVAILQGGGTVSRQQVVTHTHAEYDKFRAQMAERPSRVEVAYPEAIKGAQKEAGGKK